MNAKEASFKSKMAAEELETKRLEKEKIILQEKIKELEAAQTRWKERFSKDVRNGIEYSVNLGCNDNKMILNSASHHADPLYTDYLRNFEFADKFQEILEELRNDGYDVQITYRTVHHDDTIAYMNSGGECGSETPYFTYHTVLVVKWN